jgi:hypothetical protein
VGWNILIDEIILDVKTAKKMDPAAKSYAEILFLYQGGSCADYLSDCTLVIYKKTLFLGKMDFSALTKENID